MNDYHLFILFLHISFISLNIYRKWYLNLKLNLYDGLIWSLTLITIPLSLQPVSILWYIMLYLLQSIYFYTNFKNIHKRDSIQGYRDTIIDAIHSLPYGVLLYDEDNNIHLVNNIMIDLGAHLQDGLFSHPETLWEDILHRANDDHTLKLYGEEPIIQIEDTVWRFYKLKHHADQHIYHEIYALDTTLLYQTLIDIEKETLNLKKQRYALKHLIKHLFTNHKQEEVLNYKINIHNNMGEAILRSQYALKENKHIEQELNNWRTLLIRLNQSFSDQKNKSTQDKLDNLIKAGEDIGCSLHINGHFPHQKPYADTVYEAIREAMVNAKKHAQAENVYVNIETIDKTIEIMIYNDGLIPPEDFELKGGLRHLKDKIEKAWGSVKFYPQENFTIMIHFPY